MGEKSGNIVQEKSYAFALRIVRMTDSLFEQGRAIIPARQVLESGTSIGANIEEALGAHSRKEFLWKMSISYKEARETHYWLRLLRDAPAISPALAEALLADCEELLRLLTAIQKTMRKE